MNDPGLDGAVADEAGALDESRGYASAKETEEQQVDAQYPHAARWWLASTAYPLAAVCDIVDYQCRRGMGLTLV